MFAWLARLFEGAARAPAAPVPGADPKPPGPEVRELQRTRTITLEGEIDDLLANEVIAKLLFLQFEDEGAPIRVHVDSPGGMVTASLAIIDTLAFVSCAVETCAIGPAGGTAALIVASGARGRRTMRSGTRLSLMPLWSSRPDDDLARSEIERLTRVYEGLFAEATGRRPDEIAALSRAHRVLSPDEAKALGFIDEVVQPPAR